MYIYNIYNIYFNIDKFLNGTYAFFLTITIYNKSYSD